MLDKLKNILSKFSKKKKESYDFSSSAKPGTDFDSSVKSFFSSEGRRAVHKYFIVATVATSTYFGGKTTGLILKKKLTPKKQISKAAIVNIKPENHRANLSKITQANLFNAALRGKDTSQGKIAKVKKAPKINIEEIVCEKADKKSSLPIKLADTIVLQDRVKSIASVQVRSKKKPFNLREGEKIENLASISKIERLSMILKNLKTGQCEYVENEKAKKVKKAKYDILSPKKGQKLIGKKINDSISNEGNKFKIKKSFRSKMLSDMGSILTQARAIRMDNSDGTMCFKMTEVVPGSVYTQLDIQNEDVICGINGKKIRSLNELMSLFGKMNQIDHFELSRKRNGEEKNIEYNFE